MKSCINSLKVQLVSSKYTIFVTFRPSGFQRKLHICMFFFKLLVNSFYVLGFVCHGFHKRCASVGIAEIARLYTKALNPISMCVPPHTASWNAREINSVCRSFYIYLTLQRMSLPTNDAGEPLFTRFSACQTGKLPDLT